MQVLEDLYLGDIHPSERSFKKGSQYAKALNNVVKVGDAFIGSLTEKQKEQFEAYMTAQREVNVLTDCETFCYAFARRKDYDGCADGQHDERNLILKRGQGRLVKLLPLVFLCL